MKKILTALAALSVCLSASAYYVYDARLDGPVKAFDLSLGRDFEYQLEFMQAGLNRNDGKTYNSSVFLRLHPATHSLAGVYLFSDGSVDADTFVEYNGSYRSVFDYSDERYTKLTLTDNGDGTYTLSGSLCVTKGGYNYYYYYDALDPANTFSLFGTEPARTEIAINGSKIDLVDDTENGHVLLDVYDDNFNFIELCINSDEYALPAGDYTVSGSGEKGSIAAANGFYSGYYPIGSYCNYLYDDFFITGGSATVSYSEDRIILGGTLTSSGGSGITLSATGDSPFGTYEPDTLRLEITGITATSDVYASGKPCFRLHFTALAGMNDYAGEIVLNTDLPVGKYGYEDFGYCQFENDQIYGADRENCAEIVPSDKADEFILSARVSYGEEGDYTVCIIEDAIFNYTLPTPFDAESDIARTFDFTTSATAYVIDESATGNGIALKFYDGNLNCIYLCFAVNTLDAILPCRYTVSDSKTEGTLIASEGRYQGEDASDLYETYTFFGEGLDEAPYYITGGYVDVDITGSEMLFKGVLTSYKGSTINLDITGTNGGEVTVTPQRLPDNVLVGYLADDGRTYLLAHDITLSENEDVNVAITLSLPEDKKKGVRIRTGDTYADMHYDIETDEFTFTVAGAERGGSVPIELEILFGETVTEVRTINCTVQ